MIFLEDLLFIVLSVYVHCEVCFIVLCSTNFMMFVYLLYDDDDDVNFNARCCLIGCCIFITLFKLCFVF